jgi:hypothetical protein
MNESDKKLVTEWLGEKRFEWKDEMSTDEVVAMVTATRRTFTEDSDFFACFNRLVELGEWTKFEWWSIQRQPIGSVSYIQWLLSRTESGHYRLCVLCAERLAQKEG